MAATPGGDNKSLILVAVDEESEFTRLKKEESLSKQNILGDMPRIIQKNELDSLIVQQITTILFRFEMLLAQGTETSTITRIKIYELLTMMLRLQCREIELEIAAN